MRAPSAMDLLAAWERGEPQHPLDRALTLLASALPGQSRAALAALPLPERDRLLWELRRDLFGPELEFRLACPECSGQLAGSFRMTDAQTVTTNDEPALARVCWSGRDHGFRLPTSHDLAAVARDDDDLGAMRGLAARCLVLPAEDSARLPPESLTPAGLEELSRQFTAVHPQLETRLDFDCPDCAHQWSVPFDIAGFLWTEWEAQAQRLLREVDALARAYGWNETEILSLSPDRRAAYLELAAS